MSTGFTYANVGWVEDDEVYIRQDVFTAPGQIITYNSTTQEVVTIPAGTPGQVLISTAGPTGLGWSSVSGLGSITVTPSGPLTVTGSPVSLGGSIILTNTALNSVGTRDWIAGTGSSYSGADAVAVGDTASAAVNSVSIGSAAASLVNSTSVGRSASTNNSSAAFGAYSVAVGANSIAMGHTAIANNNYGVCLGSGSTASGVGAMVIGQGANATGNYSLAVGRLANATADYAQALGTSITNNAQNTTIIGNGAIGTTHIVYTTGFYQCRQTCSARVYRDFFNGDPSQSIALAAMPQNITYVQVDYDTFIDQNGAFVSSWSGAPSAFLNLYLKPLATYRATFNVRFNYQAIYATPSTLYFQIVYDNNGTLSVVADQESQQSSTNILNGFANMSAEFRVGNAPAGNQRIYARVSQQTAAAGATIDITRVHFMVTRLN